MQLIPAIDLLDGRVTRLWQGDFLRPTRYSELALECAERWRAQGASALHVVDLNAARNDAKDNRELVHLLAGIEGLAVQCAGGVRSEADIKRLLNSGAARVVIGSLAVTQRRQVKTWLQRYGSEQLVIALDIRTNSETAPEALTRGWQDASGMSLWFLLDEYVTAGLTHLLCTDVARDGTLAGPNIALYMEVLARYPGLILQASGGVGGINDVHALRDARVPAAILGRALLEGRLSLNDALSAAA